MSDWTDFLQGVAILLLAFACISNSLWIRQVNRYFRDQEKQRQRNRRIIAGLRGADSEAKQTNAHSREQEPETATKSISSDSDAISSSTHTQSRDRIL